MAGGYVLPSDFIRAFKIVTVHRSHNMAWCSWNKLALDLNHAML